MSTDESPRLAVEAELIILCAVAHVKELDSALALLNEVLNPILERQALMAELDLARERF